VKKGGRWSHALYCQVAVGLSRHTAIAFNGSCSEPNLSKMNNLAASQPESGKVGRWACILVVEGPVTSELTRRSCGGRQG
jgi:hypothetical protein